MTVDRGSVVVAALDPTRGHEPQGMRPCLVISDPEVAAHQRFPMVCVVPLTGTSGEGALYPAIGAGSRSGLAKTSYAMTDQLRSIDKRRIRRLLGIVRQEELEAVEEGLRLYLGI